MPRVLLLSCRCCIFELKPRCKVLKEIECVRPPCGASVAPRQHGIFESSLEPHLPSTACCIQLTLPCSPPCSHPVATMPPRHRRSAYSLEAIQSLPSRLDIFASSKKAADSNPAGAVLQLVRATQAAAETPSNFGLAGEGGSHCAPPGCASGVMA